MRMRWLAVLMLAVCIAGCAPQKDVSKLKEDVLEQDPSFAGTLARKESIDKEISRIKKGFSEELTALEVKIAGIRAEIKRRKAALDKEALNLKSQLDPYRQSIAAELKGLGADFREKEASLKRVNAMEQNARAMLEKKIIPPPEKSKWQDMMVTFQAEAKKLQDEIKSLQGKADLRKAQLHLLRQ